MECLFLLLGLAIVLPAAPRLITQWSDKFVAEERLEKIQQSFKVYHYSQPLYLIAQQHEAYTAWEKIQKDFQWMLTITTAGTALLAIFLIRRIIDLARWTAGRRMMNQGNEGWDD